MACCGKCARYKSSDEKSDTGLDSSPEKSEKLSLGSSIELGMGCCDVYPSDESSDEYSDTDLDSSSEKSEKLSLEKSEKLSLGSPIELGIDYCDAYPSDEGSDVYSDTDLDSLPDQTEFGPPEERQKWIDLYRQQVDDSDGFDVDDFIGRFTILAGMVVPVPDPGSSNLATRIKVLADLGIKIYNKIHATCYNSVEVEKVNMRGGSVLVLYITFKAKDGDIVNTFQASGDIRIPQKNGARHVSVRFCRLKGDRQIDDWNGDLCCCGKA